MYRDYWKPGWKAWKRFPEERIPAPLGECFLTVQRFLSPCHSDGEPHIAPLYFDFDGKEGGLEIVAREALELVAYLCESVELPQEAIRLYFTGGRGIHVEVAEQALGAQPSPDLTYAYRLWAHDVAQCLHLTTLDLAVYSCRRMWRQVGSRHARTGLYKVPVAWQDLAAGPERLVLLARAPRGEPVRELVELAPVAAWLLGKYLARVRSPAPVPASAPRVPRGYVPPCVSRLLRRFWRSRGESNRASLVLATWLRASGCELADAAATVAGWLERAPGALFWSKPDPQREAAKVVRCVYEHGYPFACRFPRALGLCSPMCEVRDA